MADGSTRYDGGKAYKDSKLANMLFFRELQKKDAFDGVDVLAFSPGFIPTTGLIRATRAPLLSGKWLKANAFAFVATNIAGFATTADVGGARLAYMATAALPSGTYLAPSEVGSKGTTLDDGFTAGIISAEARDDRLAKLLWERSEELVGLAASGS